MTIQDLIKEDYITEENGKYYCLDLDLHGTQVTELPENLTVMFNLSIENTPLTQLPKNLTVGGDELYFDKMKFAQLPDNLTIRGCLDLSDTQITQLPNNLIVGGGLDLSRTQIKELPNDLIVGGSLDLEDTQITQLPDNLTVGGCLCLAGTQITQLPYNLTVGGYLDLRGTQIIQFPNNLTIGGDLLLNKWLLNKWLNMTQPPNNLSIRGDVKIANVKIPNSGNYKKLPQNHIFTWQNGKYIKIDRIFSEFIKKKGSVYVVKMIGEKDLTYIVTDSVNFAHGKTIREAKKSLLYKVSEERDIAEYKSMNENTILTFKKCIEAYRAITGACEFGVKNFVANMSNPKKKYAIQEVIELTKNQYGNEAFAEFFMEGSRK